MSYVLDDNSHVMLFATCSIVFTDIEVVIVETRDTAGVVMLAEPDWCIALNI
jgi:hypothetical protein